MNLDSPYKMARKSGYCHEEAIIFASHGVVDEELNTKVRSMDAAELQTIIANARTDINSITKLLAGTSAILRGMQWMMFICMALLIVIALKS